MIMVMINWLKLLAASEKAFFLIIKVILSDLSNWVVLQNYHWIRELSCVFDLRGGKGGPSR